MGRVEPLKNNEEEKEEAAAFSRCSSLCLPFAALKRQGCYVYTACLLKAAKTGRIWKAVK